ncbi:MAG: hypothetical protein PHN84_06815 [Desulfuromonadaceae bacterium]|nr:hypothetical protein [Desulfuromonadaceae bacterium]MDD2854146.1 hypothetical protein [Desulfuromonadaceae bacterium]
MDLFEELRATALRQHEEGELPKWLIKDIFTIADKPEQYFSKSPLVKLLANQIDNFDAYAGAGCFDVSVSAETIRATINKILE